MKKTVDFYYDYISSASYLAWTQLPDICKQAGATLNYKPMLLGGVFKAVGNTSPITIPAKWEWMKRDIERHANYYGVPYQLNPHFIFSTVKAMRGAMWALSEGRIEEFNQVMFPAAWADGKDLASVDVLEEILTNANINASEVLEATGQSEFKQALIDATDAAVEAGAFGAPTIIVDGELFFGQDRLEWVKRALATEEL